MLPPADIPMATNSINIVLRGSSVPRKAIVRMTQGDAETSVKITSRFIAFLETLVILRGKACVDLLAINANKVLEPASQ